eukprot:TRINITY_DN25728_c0_g1_i1.p1 TRINITY_DN25728_c0_g1~~TRINITY_DN25728_c0_g1_i1.p1  ORF type:complete len:251 (+),score=52.81 TRINITY_DN25728_c0_g1_i1:226-978(+)
MSDTGSNLKPQIDRARALTSHNISSSNSGGGIITSERQPPSPAIGSRHDSSRSVGSDLGSPRGSSGSTSTAPTTASGGGNGTPSMLRKALNMWTQGAPKNVSFIRPVMTGWLLRKSKLRKVWEPVWCILTSSELLLFNNRTEVLGDDETCNAEMPIDEVPDERFEMKKIKCVQQELDVTTVETSAASAANLNPAYEEMFQGKHRDDKVYIDVLVLNVIAPERTVASLGCGSRPVLNMWLNAMGRVFINHY